MWTADHTWADGESDIGPAKVRRFLQKAMAMHKSPCPPAGNVWTLTEGFQIRDDVGSVSPTP
jgi:hypothetical protein